MESNLFIQSSFSGYAAFYQQLLKGILSYEGLAARVLVQIKTAHAFRQTEKVRELARILTNLPLTEPRLIGQCYLVWCDCREQNYQTTILESVVDQTRSYKAHALISRAAIDFYQGKFDDALRFYLESLKARPTLSEYALAVKGIAVIKSVEGFTTHALRDLGNLTPILRYTEPLAYFDCLNSYAVELGKSGNVDDARAVSKRVLASPFASAYPEWRETRAEIELRGYRASRSIVAFDPRPSEVDNLVRLPPPEHSLTPAPTRRSQPARVLSFLDGKKKMDKESNGPPRDYSKMSGRELLLKILEVVGSSDRTDDELSRMLGVIERVLSESKKPKK